MTAAPNFFDLTEDTGQVLVLKAAAETAAEQAAVRAAIAMCPMGAISLQD